MKLKEKVEEAIYEMKMVLESEEKKKNFIIRCFYIGEYCKVICAVVAPEGSHAITREDIPCTAQEYEEFARSCIKDSKWIVQKLLFWKGAICYYRE